MKKLLPIFDGRNRSHLRPVKRNFVNKMTGEGYRKTVYVKPSEFDAIMKRRNERGGEMSKANEIHRKQGAAKAGGAKRRVDLVNNNQASGHDMKQRILRDGDFALEQMFLMNEFQTDFEKVIKGTKFKNNVGFNKPDAVFVNNFLDKIKQHGGLGRYAKAIGDANFNGLVKNVQGRMLKYGNQLADIHNDDNRYRNFKTIEDAFRNAKGGSAAKMDRFNSAIRPISGAMEQSFNGKANSISVDLLNKMNEGFRRGPKQKADAIIKRFDNAKFAGEVQNSLRIIGNNPRQAVVNRFNEMMLSDPDGFKEIHQMMQGGFGALNMGQKNKLKDFMKKQAPFLADIFNMYKDAGMAVPIDKAFRGKGLKQIKGENAIGGVAGGGGTQQTTIPPVKNRVAIKTGKQSKNVLRNAEVDFENQLPTTINRNDMQLADRQGINGTHLLNKGTEFEMYYKPNKENRNFETGAINEVMGYELTKQLGIEGIIPPTKMQSPEINEGGGVVSPSIKNTGSTQLSTRQYGKKMGMTDIKAASLNMDEAIYGDSNNNIQDLVAYDYIISNTDRHTGNFHVGKSASGGYQSIGIDHGFAFGERDSFYYDGGSLDHYGTKKRELSSAFQTAIKNFDVMEFTHTANTVGLSLGSQDGVIRRVKALNGWFEENPGKSMTLGDVLKVSEKRKVRF